MTTGYSNTGKNPYIERRKQLKFYRNMQSMIGEWYGPDRKNAELAHFFRRETSIGDAVSEVMNTFQSEDATWIMRVQSLWPEIAGQKAAKVTKPVGFNDGILTVEISHPSWIRELGGRKLEKTLADNVNREIGSNICKKVIIVPFGRYQADKSKEEASR